MSDQKISRRRALGSVGAIVAGTVAGSKMASGQTPAAPRERRRGSRRCRFGWRRARSSSIFSSSRTRRRRSCQPATFALVAGGDRALFDRITLRPRMNIPTTDMDLTVNLFGEDHFTPIIVAPIADQKRFHPDAELATAKGAAAGKALMIVSSRSSVPLAEIAARGEAVVLVSGLCVRRRREDAGAGCGQSRRQGDCDYRRRLARGEWRASRHGRLDQLVLGGRDQAGRQRSCHRERHHDAGRSDGGAAAQRAGHHRLELRRTAREQGRDDPRAAGHRRCGRRQSAGADGWLVPPRHGHPEGARVWREGRAARPSGDVGACRVRRRRRAERHRDGADRARRATWACAASRT